MNYVGFGGGAVGAAGGTRDCATLLDLFLFYVPLAWLASVAVHTNQYAVED